LLRSCPDQFEEFEKVTKSILTDDDSGLFEASALEISNSALEDRYLHVVYALKCLHLGLVPPESVVREVENEIVSYSLMWPRSDRLRLSAQFFSDTAIVQTTEFAESSDVEKLCDDSRYLSSIGVGEITSLEDGLKDLAQKLSKYYSLGPEKRETLDGWFR
jgi:hypothetical protein